MSKPTKKLAKNSSTDIALTKKVLKLATANIDSLSAQALTGKESTEDKTMSLTDEQLAILITTAKLQYSNLKDTIVKEKKREIESLDVLIKEFMGPFILIGYDTNNNAIEMVSANTSAEHDALLERLRRLMFRINQNIANSNGTDPYGQYSN